MSQQQSERIAGRYELQALAGEGGMATVWRGVMHGAAGFSRVVAIKEIKSEFGAMQNYIDMFVEEARVGSDLAHPNIVQVYDFVIEKGRYYLVLEWVEGLDLASYMRILARWKQPMSWQLAATIGVYVLHGLGAAHDRRRPDGSRAPVVHRDVSPPNILLGTNGSVKITDFGLARARDRIYSLTAPGTVKGKLCYLSPEVAHGKPATPLSDLFSTGVVLWEMLTGRRLFNGPSDLDVFNQIRRCQVPSLRGLRPDVPERMSAAIHRSLMADPERRYPSARAMAAELVEVLRTVGVLLDLQSLMAEAITDAYRRRKVLDEEPSSDEYTRPKLSESSGSGHAGRSAMRAPALFGDQPVAVEFSDSDEITMPEAPGLGGRKRGAGSSRSRHGDDDHAEDDTLSPTGSMPTDDAEP